GNPKGVMVSHGMYVAAGQGFAHWTEATAEDRFFTCLPYFHANVQYYSTMGSLAAGATRSATWKTRRPGSPKRLRLWRRRPGISPTH
ncbi:MAG: AMP-binding protein, partial [Candidatus Krumholzibacteriota bacterium]|nr:AMP-binding protein [Candidatus Krumholzibacteriota bacterium]